MAFRASTAALLLFAGLAPLIASCLHPPREGAAPTAGSTPQSNDAGRAADHGHASMHDTHM